MGFATLKIISVMKIVEVSHFQVLLTSDTIFQSKAHIDQD